MALTSISRSAFSRTGTKLTMKPGVQTLSVGTIDVIGINIDNNSIGVSNGSLQFTNENGTKNFSFTEDIISGGLIKPELMPDRALTQIYTLADTDALLLLPSIQIGDIAIKADDNLTYIAKNGDNESINDWQKLAMAYSHPASLFEDGDKTDLDNSVAHVILENNPHQTSLNNLYSIAGGYTYTPHTTDKDSIGLANSSPASQKRMEKIISKEFSFGFNDNAEENTFVEWKIPEQDWEHVYNFLTSGTGNTEYSIARLQDIPGGTDSSNLTPIFEGDETNEGGGESSTIGGGVIQIGSSDNGVLQGDTLGTIEFYTKDDSFIQLEPSTDSFVNLPLHVHAKISAESTLNFDNAQTAIAGQSALSRQGVDDGGEDTQMEDVFYQKDASIHFFTGRQNSIQKNFSVFHDGSLGIKPIDFSSNGTDLSSLEPQAITGITKLFSNITDNNIYLYNKSGSDTIKRKLLYESITTVPSVGETTTVYSDVQFKDLTANDIYVNGELDVTTLKVGGLEIDLDNLITEYDYWSESANELQITQAGVNFTGTETKDIDIPALGTLIPTDANLLDVVVLLRWRLMSNSDISNVNTIQGGTVTIKKSDVETQYPVLTFVTGSYFTPANSSAGGDMLIRQADVGDLTSFKALLTSGATFNLLLNNITSEYNNLSLRDFSWGIRLYWR